MCDYNVVLMYILMKLKLHGKPARVPLASRFSPKLAAKTARAGVGILLSRQAPRRCLQGLRRRAGLRASELRGLRWIDVDLKNKKGELRVAPACRSPQQNWLAEISAGPAHRAVAADRRERTSSMETEMPEAQRQPRARVPQRPGQPRIPR